MQTFWKRPTLTQVKINDPFWTPYLENIRTVTLPYVMKKFEETGYLDNYRSVLAKDGAVHLGPPFSDGLLQESLRGACDFYLQAPTPALKQIIDPLVDLIAKTAASDPDGYLCTATTQGGEWGKPYPYPSGDIRWGEHGGDIIVQHDLYNHGTLIEAGISHYLATGETTLLLSAVRAANYICQQIGEPPKYNVVPGHSLPEEAFLKLYRLFRDTRALDSFAAEHHVNIEDYLRLVQFWYDSRGCQSNRSHNNPTFPTTQNQDHLPFAQQTTAVGHAVRATLCYTGAAALTYETKNEAFLQALNRIWEDVTRKKMHISGGIGSDHRIEGFDVEYNLRNDAYLETCAAIGLAFWAGEMSLLQLDSDYFDTFERSLYNNILASIGEDFLHYFYQNPLISDGSVHRWDWHGCPCCPPMLLKLYSSLNTYVYSYRESDLAVHLYMDSTLTLPDRSITQKDRLLSVDSQGKPLTLRLRIPDYAEKFTLRQNQHPVAYTEENGYACVTDTWSPDLPLEVAFDQPIRRICANPKVEADLGSVAIQKGPYVYCAEGFDNGGSVDLTLPAQPNLSSVGDEIIGHTAENRPFRLIPYYRWCNRTGTAEENRMQVWFHQEDMLSPSLLAEKMQTSLYADYDKLLG